MSEKSLPKYTISQLALCNGRDRVEIWCGFGGKIYDLGRSKLWRGGIHYEHWAGADLTDELVNAPHGEKVFEKFEIVGVLDK